MTHRLRLQLKLAADDVTYEAAYNTACAMIDAGDLVAARKQLDLAESEPRLSFCFLSLSCWSRALTRCVPSFVCARAELCRENLVEDGLSEAEIQDEIAAILVQKAFVLQLHELDDDARALYNQVLQSK